LFWQLSTVGIGNTIDKVCGSDKLDSEDESSQIADPAITIILTINGHPQYINVMTIWMEQIEAMPQWAKR
jgi:hypothetical protein